MNFTSLHGNIYNKGKNTNANGISSKSIKWPLSQFTCKFLQTCFCGLFVCSLSWVSFYLCLFSLWLIFSEQRRIKQTKSMMGDNQENNFSVKIIGQQTEHTIICISYHVSNERVTSHSHFSLSLSLQLKQKGGIFILTTSHPLTSQDSMS